jgi:tetratricopeptide (TPR) repeat protein/MFS family permease
MENLEQGKKKFGQLILPNATAFVASFCIMVIELVAGRIIARYLGASLYTWTSVIGIVLLGVALGNYFGGYIADRYRLKNILALFFILSALSCLLVPVFNKLAGEFYLFWLLPWPVRIALHITFVFLLPSAMLGVILPVITKFALDCKLLPGRTVGSVYAFSAAGSIFGTFAAGFLLIPYLGTLAIVWSVAFILISMGVFFSGKKGLSFYLGATAFILFALLSFWPYKWSQAFAQQLGLREAPDPLVLYQKESAYSYIQVKGTENSSKIRKLVFNQLLHSIVDVEKPWDLNVSYQYPYLKLYGAVTRWAAENKKDLRVLVIGGGGYVFPRYIQKTWPESLIDVVEIDPQVTQAAVEAFGFDKNPSVSIYHMDARNFVDDVLRSQKQLPESFPPYDFIYCDTFGVEAVPYQLTTFEFNTKVKKLLSPEGFYAVTIIDTLRSGKFLGAMVATLEKIFPYVKVFSAETQLDVDYARLTFTIFCSQKPLDFNRIDFAATGNIQLGKTQLETILSRSRGMILSDDYAPVDNLLEPLAYQCGLQMASAKLTELANALVKEKKVVAAVRYYRKALDIFPEFYIAHNNLGNILMQLGNNEEALRHFNEALRIFPHFSKTHSNIAALLTREGKFNQAIEHYRQALSIRPDSAEIHYNLGTTLVYQGKLSEAIQEYRRALEINPEFSEAHGSLGNVYFTQGNTQEALQHYKDALRFCSDCAQIHNNIAAILVSQGNIDEAVSHYREAIRIAPGYEKARQNLQAALTQKAKKADREVER